MNEDSAFAVGLDISDRRSTYCAVDQEGRVIEEGRVENRADSLAALADRFSGAQWTLEAGTHSFWMDRLLRGRGLEVVVVNPRRLRVVSDSLKKTDRSDAATLALLGLFNPQLLWQVRHRGYDAQLALTKLKARDALVRTRTRLINTIRGLVKSFGGRLPRCDADRFHQLREDLPEELAPALHPLFDVLDTVQDRILVLEARIDELAQSRDEVRRLMTVPGVGSLTALAFVLVLDDPTRFAKSRHVGPYLGLTTRVDQSGQVDKQLRITKAGDEFLRRLLIQCAQSILRPNTRDTALKQWGLALVDRGGRAAKKKATVAVARKLAVLLHHLWISGETFTAFPKAA
jgi:transposase